MNTPIFSELSIVTLADLDRRGVIELSRWCNKAAEYDSARGRAEREADRVLQLVRDTKNELRKKREEAIAPKLRTWLRTHAKPGTRLKMTGCRDGQGIREVLKLWDSGGEEGLSIECRQVLVCHGKESLGGITNHYYNKVSKAWIDGVWVSVRAFLSK